MAQNGMPLPGQTGAHRVTMRLTSDDRLQLQAQVQRAAVITVQQDNNITSGHPIF